MTRPATWDTVHMGDTVMGADGRGWTVVERGEPRTWLASGVTEAMFRLALGERVVTAIRGLEDGAAVIARADHSGEAVAVQALIDAGLTATVLREGSMSETTEMLQGTTDHPSGACQHPAEKLSTLKSGKVKCAACKTYLTPPPEPKQPAAPAASPDPFDSPAPAGKRREAPKGKWGWYKLPRPDGSKDDEIWPRVTTISKTLSDEYGLTMWKLRMAVKGVALRPDLIARAAAADVETDGSVLDGIVKSAHERAETSASANFGSALHKFAERLDAGESVASMGVPSSLRGDLEAYARTLKAHGLTVLPEYSERTVLQVAEFLPYAGTWDRIVRDRAGNLYVLDLKTGQDLSYAWLEIAMQEAMYAQASHLCSLDFTGYEPMPPIDTMKALVLHLPLGSGAGQIYAVDIAKGWRAVGVAAEVRAMRTEAKTWSWLVQPENPAAVVRLHLDRAETVEQLIEVVNLARRTGRWTDELDPYVLGRYDLIRARGAGSRDELAALWEELAPAGRWTDAVNEAAQERAVLLAAD